MRTLRALIGLLLLPVCVAASRTAFALIRTAAPAGAGVLSAPEWAMLAGFLLWIVLYLTVPRPVTTYVLAHELTHALWALLSGESVSRLRVSRRGGSVAVTHPNVAILLAPYCFPLYTVLVVLLYGLLLLFWDIRPFYLLWLGLVGFTWSFHVSFTIGSLSRRQSDIQRCGYLFSYAVIYLVNVLSFCLWIVAVGTPTLPVMGRLLWTHALSAWAACLWAAQRAVAWACQAGGG